MTPLRRDHLRVGIVTAMLGAGFLVACGSDDGSASDTLPPIATTTTTTTMAPTTTTIPDSYVIASGDTLFSIASMFGLTTDELALANGIVNQDDIDAGERIKIPQPGSLNTTTIVAGTGSTVPGATAVDASSTSVGS